MLENTKFEHEKMIALLAKDESANANVRSPGILLRRMNPLEIR